MNNTTAGEHRICTICSTVNTPLWRRNRAGELVCNACGMLKFTRGIYEKANKLDRPKWLQKRSREVTEMAKYVEIEGSLKRLICCANCSTYSSPLWRRDSDGNSICNACGLYFKLHGVKRPAKVGKQHRDYGRKKYCYQETRTPLHEINSEAGSEDQVWPSDCDSSKTLTSNFNPNYDQRCAATFKSTVITNPMSIKNLLC
jgi:GATA-binding protein 4